LPAHWGSSPVIDLSNQSSSGDSGEKLIMCSPIETNPQARRLTLLGMLCLALSAGSQSLNFTFGFGPNPLDFLRGFFLGLSMTLMLYAVRLRRHGQRTS
jgi:hypothetical protein